MRRLDTGSCLLGIVIGIGLLVRWYAASLGENFDMGSYRIVAEIVAHGGNVYQETERYNYGPGWMLCLYLFKQVTRLLGNQVSFRYVVSGWLTIVDLGLMYVLIKKVSWFSGAVFWLNPISILITGYHGQFDNFAMLVAWTGMLVYENSRDISKKRLWLGSTILGLSIILKHVFIFFPIWWAMKEKGWENRLVILVVPWGLFLGSFLPFMKGGYENIRENVFLYKSHDNAPLFTSLVPDAWETADAKRLFFGGAMVASGYLLRNTGLFESAIWYGGAMVTFSSGMTNQYLAIGAPFAAVNLNTFSVAYLLFGGYHLLRDADGLHVWGPSPDKLFGYRFTRDDAYTALVWYMFLALGWVYLKKRRVRETSG